MNLGGYAWSELPDYPIATIGCYRLVPDGDVEFTSKPVSVFGTTVTAEVYTYVSTNPITETQTQTFSKTAGMVAVSIAPLVTLIHQAADITSNDGNTSSTASAASAGRAGGLNGAGLVACLWAASLAVGILYTSIL